MTPPPPPDLDDLQRRLRDEDPVQRTLAAKELGRRGPDAAPAASDLAERLDDGDPMVRAMAAAALGKIGSPAADHAPAVAALLEDAVFPVRFWACDALGRLGQASPNARATLERLGREDPHQAVRHAARIATRLLGPSAWEADGDGG